MRDLAVIFRRGATIALFGVLACSCRPAAALDEAGRCYQDKLRAAAIAAQTLFACRLVGEAGERDHDLCVEHAERRVRRLFARAEQRAALGGFDCPASPEALAVAGPLSWPDRFARDIAGGTKRCRELGLRAARRYSADYARCLREDPDDADECAADAREDFVRDWRSRAESCGAADADTALARIEAETGESASRLEVRCGDGEVGGFERCDDANLTSGDGCSADCRRERCERIGGDVRCIACPDGAEPDEDYESCRCPDGFAGEPGDCTDIDECTTGEASCPEGRPCVDLDGGWACAIPCTADAFHAAIASCGAPSGAIAFDCANTTIRLPIGSDASLRQVACDGLVIDGAGRNITFELDPLCWQSGVDPEDCPGGLYGDGSCYCPDIDSGDAFVELRGNGAVVRDLTVRGFFEGIPARGSGNLVEDVRFDRMCDDAFGSVKGGFANRFRDVSVKRGCDKCSEHDGDLAPDADPRVDAHWNAIVEGAHFSACRTPVRVATSGRLLLDGVRMDGGNDIDFPCDGPRFSASASSKVVVRMENSRVEGCRRGMRFGRGVEAQLSRDLLTGNALRGVLLTNDARASIERSTIVGNGGDASQEAGFGGVAVMGQAAADLGGGTLVLDGRAVESAGLNSLCDNVGPDRRPLELHATTPLVTFAKQNWWCTQDPKADRIVGVAVVEPVLDRAPLAFRDD